MELVGLACMLTAQNGANKETTARICADLFVQIWKGKRKDYGTAVLPPHYKKLSNGDRIPGRTCRTFETQRRETESEFIDFRRC